MSVTRAVPVVNITVPVFNRHKESLSTLLALRQHSPSHCIITAVDNGSDDALRQDLVRLYNDKTIDHLFLLDKNYGVSCACNVGWRLVDAPFFMKLDNDILVLKEDWLQRIFSLWGSYKYSTILGPVWNSTKQALRQDSVHGTLWKMPESLSGAAFLVSKKVHDQIGFFSEDYGLYGEEDADYCMRCHHAGIKKFTFEAADLLHHEDTNSDYQRMGFDKTALHNANVGFGKGEGLFALNLFLYEQGLRPLRPNLRYTITQVRGHNVLLEENAHYLSYLNLLTHCADAFNACGRKPDASLMQMLRALNQA